MIKEELLDDNCAIQDIDMCPREHNETHSSNVKKAATENSCNKPMKNASKTYSTSEYDSSTNGALSEEEDD